ncbi:MAG: hypothetical protein QXL17_01445 [Candidatus Thermoplasmatota archaeon]
MQVSTVSAQQDQKNVISAQFDIRMVSGTVFHVNVSMDVEKIILTSSISYTKSDIQLLIASTERADIEMVGALKLKLRDLLEDQIRNSFSQARITENRVLPIYQNAVFYDEYTVTLTPEFFTMSSSYEIAPLVDGILDMGGVVTYSFLLHAAYGWNNTYTFILPEYLGLKFSNTANVNTQQNRITWMVLNWNSQLKTEQAQLSITEKKPTTSASSEDIALAFSLDTTPIVTNRLQLAVDINVLNIRDYAILPSFVSDLSAIPADGVRLFVKYGLMSWDALYEKTVKAVAQSTIAMIEISRLNQSLNMSFSWDDTSAANCSTPFNSSQMDSNPPVRAEFVDDDVDLRFCGMSSRAFFGLINAGARAQVSADDINFGDKLNKLDYRYDVYVYLPEKIFLNGFNVFHWNSSNPFSGKFTSEYQPKSSYSQEQISTYVEVDIKKMELNLFSFFSGKTELTATAHIKEVENIYVGKLPKEFSLSKKLNLSFLNSDAYRICIEEGVFTQDQIESYLTNKTVMFQRHLAKVLRGLSVVGIVDRTAFLDSLRWDKDIMVMDAHDPVVFSAYADQILPVNITLSIAPPSISISEQTFLLSSLGNQNVTYRFIFPQGIAIKTANSSLVSAVKDRLSTGQEFVEVFFIGSSSGDISDVLSCVLDPSPIFVLSLFLPCILSFVLLIILIIIVYLIRRKRRFGAGPTIKKPKKSKRKEAEEEATGYEGEDFYIPPPPPSSR